MSGKQGMPKRLSVEEQGDLTLWSGMLKRTGGAALIRNNPRTGDSRILLFLGEKRIGAELVNLSSTDRERVKERSRHAGDIVLGKALIHTADDTEGGINQAAARADSEIDVAGVLKERHGIDIDILPGGERRRG